MCNWRFFAIWQARHTRRHTTFDFTKSTALPRQAVFSIVQLFPKIKPRIHYPVSRPSKITQHTNISFADHRDSSKYTTRQTKKKEEKRTPLRSHYGSPVAMGTGQLDQLSIERRKKSHIRGIHRQCSGHSNLGLSSIRCYTSHVSRHTPEN